MKFLRTCLVCKSKKQKQEMHRIVKIAGKLVLDKEQKMQVRGAYVCKDAVCHDKIKKQKVFNRAFKQNISELQYDFVLNEIGSENDGQSKS